MLRMILALLVALTPFVLEVVRRKWAQQEEREKPSSEKMGEALGNRDTARIRDLLDGLPNAD